METAREALAAVQAAIHAPKTERNDFGKYNYRTAEGIIAAFKAVAPNGAAITLSDRLEMCGDRMFLIATAAFHWRGEAISSEGWAMHATAQKGLSDAQITGACSSYARKYALAGLLLVDDSREDPDGRDNRARDDKPEQAAPQEQARDPVAVRDGMLAAINKCQARIDLNRLLTSSKYQEALKWLESTDKPKAAEVAHAAVQRENAINNADNAPTGEHVDTPF